MAHPHLSRPWTTSSGQTKTIDSNIELSDNGMPIQLMVHARLFGSSMNDCEAVVGTLLAGAAKSTRRSQQRRGVGTQAQISNQGVKEKGRAEIWSNGVPMSFRRFAWHLVPRRSPTRTPFILPAVLPRWVWQPPLPATVSAPVAMARRRLTGPR